MSKPYDKDGVPYRREVPEGSGAVASVGFGWENIVQLLSNTIGDAAPEVRHKQTMWIVRARSNGVRVDFYDDEEKFYQRLEQQTSIEDGPQVHAGRLHWV